MSKQKLKKAIELLNEMVCQADEDTPNEYRTKHFTNCMSDCIDFLEKHYKENKDE